MLSAEVGIWGPSPHGVLHVHAQHVLHRTVLHDTRSPPRSFNRTITLLITNSILNLQLVALTKGSESFHGCLAWGLSFTLPAGASSLLIKPPPSPFRFIRGPWCSVVPGWKRRGPASTSALTLFPREASCDGSRERGCEGAKFRVKTPTTRDKLRRA